MSTPENSPTVDMLLREAARVYDRADVPAVWDRLTEEGGVLDFIEAVGDDPHGALAADLQEVLQRDPDAWDALLSDDGVELLADAIEFEEPEDSALDGPEYEEVLDELAERAHEDDVRLDEAVLAAHVVAHDGDVEQGYTSYRDWFRSGADPDFTAAFTKVADGDPELGAAAAQRHRDYSADSREVMRGDRLREAAEVKAEAIKGRGRLPADSLDLGEAVAEMHGEILAAKALAERDASGTPRSTESMADALAGLSR